LASFSAKIGPAGQILGGTDFGVTGHTLREGMVLMMDCKNSSCLLNSYRYIKVENERNCVLFKINQCKQLTMNSIQ